MRNFELTLIRGFDLTLDGRRVHLFPNAKRLIAFLALQMKAVPRCYVAGMLWPNVPEARAAGNLRSELWRMRKRSIDVITTRAENLDIESSVVVDVLKAECVARHVIDATTSEVPTEEDLQTLIFNQGDLLPGWYEDWVLSEREHYHRLRLQALVALCERLTADRRLPTAILAGNAAVRSDPLCESARRALMGAYLTQGNMAEAMREYQAYREILQREFGLEPSDHMASLVSELMGS